MKIKLLRHDCSKFGLDHLFNPSKIRSHKCPIYWKMQGGETYYGNIYFFTLFGIRITINTTKKKDLWIR